MDKKTNGKNKESKKTDFGLEHAANITQTRKQLTLL